MINNVFYLHTEHNSELQHKQDRASIACRVVDNVIQFGVTVCGQTDNFSREKGRNLATQRMYEGFGKVSRNTGFYSQFKDNEAAMQALAGQLAKAITKDFNKYKRRIHKYNSKVKVS